MTGERRPPERPAPEPDVGLAGERTRLAWRRTTLAASVVAVLLIRLALRGGTVGVLVAALTGLGWLAVLVVTSPRFTGPPGAGAGRPGPALPLTALASVGFAGLGVLLVVTAMR